MNDLALTNEEIKEKAVSYLDTLGFAQNLTADQKKTFIEMAIAYKLNPFIREIYAVGYKQGDKVTLSIITGYETYIKRAERTGKVEWWKTFINTDGDSECHIKRKDWSEAFIHVLDKNEFVGTSQIWKNKKFMHKKVCTSQAFRLCFPDEMGGLPYTEAENEYEHDIPSKMDDKLEKKKQKTLDNIKKLFIGVDVPDNIIVAIDNAKDQKELNKIEYDVETERNKPNLEIDTQQHRIQELLSKYTNDKLYGFGVKGVNKQFVIDKLGEERITACRDIDVLNNAVDVLESMPETYKPEIPERDIKTLRSDIILLQDDLAEKAIDGYQTQKHRSASINKHLGTITVNQCEDMDKLTAYESHLQSKLEG